MQWIILQSTVTAAQIEEQLLAAFAAVGMPTSAWVKGGIWDNLTKWFARLLALVYALILSVARNAFLATASERGLTDLAAGTFGTARRIEGFATGGWTLANDGVDPIDEGTDALTFENLDDPEVTYKNSEPVYVLPGNSTTFSIVCDVAGTRGNALAGRIALTTTLIGATGANANPIAGQDAQLDDDLRVLASKQASNLSEGVANKFEWIALNTNTDGTISAPNDGKTRLNINRVSVTNDSAIGTVTVVLASPAGAVDAGEYATAIGVLGQYVLANPGILDDYNATPVNVDIDVDVFLRKGSTAAGVAAEVEQYITNWFVSSDNGIGGDDGVLTVEELELMIGRTRSNIREVTITEINGFPAADVPLAPTEVAVLGLLNINVTVQP